jgi:hypothetical protein
MRIKKKAQKYALLNLGMVLGAIASGFVLPGNTPVWLWALVSAVVIGTLNYLLFITLRKGEGTRSQNDSRFSTALVFLGFLIFVLDLVFRLAHR